MPFRPSCLALVACLAVSAAAQDLSTPARFHLVMPNGPGGILIDTSSGWRVDHAILTNDGKRPVLQLHNDAAGVEVSYILDHDPAYYESSEACLNDALGTLMAGPLSHATVKDKKSDTRQLKNGQQLMIGSYLIAKNAGIMLDQENVWGFVANDHTCATVHLSRAPFKAGDEPLFDPLLNSFTYDPNYIPSSEDYALMAKLLPPGMAKAYVKSVKEDADAGPRPAPQSGDQSISFSLPAHTGYLHIDAPNFVITELSATPNGHEFGIRAEDNKLTHVQFLGFLFLPEPAQETAVACREWMLKSESREAGYRKVLGKREFTSTSGVSIAQVDYLQSKQPDAHQFVRRFFVASGDLCLDASLLAVNQIMADAASSLTSSLVFDPAREPGFFEITRYAFVLFQHGQVKAAAPLYERALAFVDNVPDAAKWRRVTVDQASMSYGIAGDLVRSRALNEAAIQRDPDYPMYYYTLACADAESGDAIAARKHLQQAYARRANVIPGEHMPDASQDDSILKLKTDKEFWNFVQTLPKS